MQIKLLFGFFFLSIQHVLNERCLFKWASFVLFFHFPAPTVSVCLKCLHKAPSHL